jgi:predicted RNA-binding Zn ribbon-like protein
VVLGYFKEIKNAGRRFRRTLRIREEIVTGLLETRSDVAISLIGGRLCLDFVNTVGARLVERSGKVTVRDEKLADYLDLLAWMQHAQALSAAQVTALAEAASRRRREASSVFREALLLRESLHRIFYAIVTHRKPNGADVDLLNEAALKAFASRRLVPRAGRWTWHWEDDDTSLEKPLWLIVDSAVETLMDGDSSRLRLCAGDDCGWIFEDTSRNRSRRWCDAGDCGNREHVRKFRERERR